MKNLAFRYVELGTWSEESVADVDQWVFHINEDGQVLASNGALLVRCHDQQIWNLKAPGGRRCHSLLDMMDGFVVVAYKEGAIISVSLTDGHMEEMGQVENGIDAFLASPDQELFLVITSGGSLILMTREFDPLLEKELRVDEEVSNGFVAVGWGKKETQFHGSLGKAAALASSDSSVPNQINEHDDRLTRATWRDDGQFFAVSFVKDDDQRLTRKVTIYNREGTVQAVAETIPGMEALLTWGASGLLTGSTFADKMQKVVFVEKNGLQHGEFTVPALAQEIDVPVTTHLLWNREADALLVASRTEKHFYVQIFSSTNFHWDLKQSLKLNSNVLDVQWDSSCPMRFLVFHGNGSWQAFQMSWEISYGQNHDEQEDPAYVAVTNNNTVRVTPFRYTVIPPPLCAITLKVPDKVGHVVYPPNDPFGQKETSSIGVISQAGKLFFFSESKAKNEREDVKVEITGGSGHGFRNQHPVLHFDSEVQLAEVSSALLTNMCWMKNDILIGCTSVPVPKLLAWKLSKNHQSELSAELLEDFILEEPVYSVVSDSQGVVAGIQLKSGSKLKFDSEQMAVAPWEESDYLIVSNPQVLQKMQIVSLKEKYHIIGLSEEHHKLFLDGKEIANGISSFHATNQFLMATTLKHSLKCLPLNSIGSLASLESLWSTESLRCLERGSKLVLSVPDDTKTVLQMPRGNLEVIHPRAVVIELVKKLLDQLEFGKALELLRRHRINLNLIYDHNPKLFIENIGKFAEEAKDVTRICLFIADLSEEDFTTTVYKDMYHDKQFKAIEGRSKIDVVCLALLDVLNKDETKFILPITSCLAKNSKSKTEDALLRISKIRDTNRPLAEEALKFLILLVDVNVLFDEALGLYDFDLVLFVAEHSQKDPREFVPFLNELKQLTIPYRYYKIDLHLKRYSKALEHLSKTTDRNIDEESLDLIKTQRLYNLGLNLYKHQNESLFQEICMSYGNYLMSKKYYEEAAVVFDRGNFLNDCVNAWRMALNWKYCLSKAMQLEMSPDSFFELCKDLTERLKEEKRHFEASQILCQFMDDQEEGLSILVEGECWNEAYLLIAQCKRKDLLETHFKPSLRNAAAKFLETLSAKAKLFHDSLGRLEIVVATKEKISAGMYDEVDVNVEDADLFSETNSTVYAMSAISAKKSHPASLQTRQTGRTKSSKNRRKQDRKKYSTKEGSVFEDVALVSVLHECISWAIKNADGTGKLTRALLMIDEEEKARKVQQELSDLLDEMKQKFSKIWTLDSNPTSSSNDTMKYGPEATINDIIERQQDTSYKIPYHNLEPHMRYPPKLPSESWKLQILLS